VHRHLAVNLAMYCDNSGALQLAVSQAISTLADRPSVATAPAPSFSVETFPVYRELRAKADGILALTAAEEKAVMLKERGLTVEQQSLEMQKQKLAMHPDLLAATEKKYRAKERHSVEMVNIKVSNTERTASVKRKAQAAADKEKLERFKKATAAQAQTTAAKDNQDQLRSAASRMPDYWSSRDPCNRGVNGSHSTSNPAPARTTRAERVAAGTFILADAAEKAAVQLSVPAFEVKRFMGSSQGGYTMYQTVIKREKLERKGSTITHSVKFGWNDTGMYCARNFNSAINWIKTNYKSI
jgi:hypothetical protein